MPPYTARLLARPQTPRPKTITPQKNHWARQRAKMSLSNNPKVTQQPHSSPLHCPLLPNPLLSLQDTVLETSRNEPMPARIRTRLQPYLPATHKSASSKRFICLRWNQNVASQTYANTNTQKPTPDTNIPRQCFANDYPPSATNQSALLPLVLAIANSLDVSWRWQSQRKSRLTSAHQKLLNIAKTYLTIPSF